MGGEEAPYRRAAVLAAQLPDGSRTMGRLFPERSLDSTAHLVLATLNTLRQMAGADPVDPFARRPAPADPEAVARALAAPRKEL